MENFSGSKLALFIGSKLLVYLRDNFEGLRYAGMWDLPGGGKEGNETPEECVLRELEEEFSLKLSKDQLVYKSQKFNRNGNRIYFFAAHCHERLADQIKFGHEGQYYKLVEPCEFLNEKNAISHLKDQLRSYIGLKST